MVNITWTQLYEDLLRQYLPMLGEQPLTPSTRLADAGLDSLGSVGLLVELEETLAISIPDHRLGPDTFSTAGGLWALIVDLGGDHAE